MVADIILICLMGISSVSALGAAVFSFLACFQIRGRIKRIDSDICIVLFVNGFTVILFTAIFQIYVRYSTGNLRNVLYIKRYKCNGNIVIDTKKTLRLSAI